jgi:hypothetical protein
MLTVVSASSRTATNLPPLVRARASKVAAGQSSRDQKGVRRPNTILSRRGAPRRQQGGHFSRRVYRHVQQHQAASAVSSPLFDRRGGQPSAVADAVLDADDWALRQGHSRRSPRIERWHIRGNPQMHAPARSTRSRPARSPPLPGAGLFLFASAVRGVPWG